MSQERVGVTRYEGGALIAPIDYLGGSFAIYLAATRRAGAKYDKAQKGQRVTEDKIGIAVRALEEAGFHVEIDNSLRESVEALTPEDDFDEQGMIDELAERGLTPYPFQLEGIRWLRGRKRALIADQMGLGKTVQSLLAAPRGHPVLVVCPASLKRNWAKETRLWRPDLRIRILEGRGSFRWPCAPRRGAKAPELLIVNWDILPPVEAEDYKLPPPPEGVVVIADEAQAVKNSKGRRVKNEKTGKIENKAPLRTSRFKALGKVVQSADGYLWPMTGTPIENNPLDLWNVLQAANLGRETFGGWQGFLKAFGGYRGEYGLQWGNVSPEVPRMLKATMLRRRREQVLPDLPVKTWTERECHIDDDTRAVCDEVMRALLDRGIDLEAALDNVHDTALKNIPFEEISRARAALATAKIPEMMAMVEEYEDAEEPLGVFCAHRAPIDLLGARDGWMTITGDTSGEERERAVEAFQAGRLKGIALTIKAGGTGLTLTHGAHEVFVDLAWTPAANAQAEDRFCRIGQTRGVMVTRLVADHLLDQKVTALLAGKQKLIEASIEKATTQGPDTKGARTYADPEPKAQERDPTDRGSRPAAGPRFKRPAQTALERWAAETLLNVAADDPDRAAKQNGVGFSAFDGEIGHSLSEQIRSGRGLSDKQWSLVCKLGNKYRRQASAPKPEGD